jgi:hypothetical protein
VFAIFGVVGQAVYNRADARNSELAEKEESKKKNSFLNSKWSPMKVLSDSEYENMLREKLLRTSKPCGLKSENEKRLNDLQSLRHDKHVYNDQLNKHAYGHKLRSLSPNLFIKSDYESRKWYHTPPSRV